MLQIFKISIILQMLINIAIAAKVNPSTEITMPMKALNLTDRNFQIDFLNEVRKTVNQMALQQLNEFLKQLKPNTRNSLYAQALESTTQSNELATKILFIKQFLDVEHVKKGADDDDDDADVNEQEATALRNVNFLEKLEKQLHDIQEASIIDLRQFRLYQLCKQFREKSGGIRQTTFKPPYSVRGTKLVPIDESNIDVALKKLNQTRRTISINLNEFGRTLYGRVNVAGAEIIDDYLTSLHKLLQEVIVDKHAHEQETSELSKLLHEIENVLATEDFYEKRQKLYGYLEENLATDYEQFKNSEHAQEDLAELLTKLRERGLDLFVTFLFSNFELLERFHKELEKLLPITTDITEFDEISRLLYEVHTSYNDFKRDAENNDKYDIYMEAVKNLYARTSSLGDDAHIFELLHNASLNVGSVTLNMIRAKCNDN